jgi:glycosyltransferase involved in cell wall biosynthesis
MLRISVVIPTYQRPDLLFKCIGALREQTVPLEDFEIIVVSDGPDPVTAKALEILENRPTNLQYLPLPKKALKQSSLPLPMMIHCPRPIG